MPASSVRDLHALRRRRVRRNSTSVAALKVLNPQMMRLLVCLSVIGPFASFLSAQESRFDIRSRLVLVPVNVFDANGRVLDGLEASDFQLLDNGRPQKILLDTSDSGVAPIALVIAVQSSGISSGVVEKLQDLGAMIQPLVTGERGYGAILSFDQQVTWLQDFTNDASLMKAAFYKIRPVLRPGEDKEGRMLDAVQSAIERLSQRAGVRRVLLLISESRDRGSETPLETVAVAAQSAGVTVYAATYSAFKTGFAAKSGASEPRRRLKPRMPTDEMGSVNGKMPGKYNPWPRTPPPEQQIDALGGIGELARLYKTNTTEALARCTGGAQFSFTRRKALEEAIQKLGAELHSQYILSFVPADLTAGYHALEVKLNRSGEFGIRARPGYWLADLP